jgi:hypothetical protein
MTDILREDASHRKQYVFNKREVGFDRRIYYPEVFDYILHYLKYLNVEMIPSSYIDTILEEYGSHKGELIDRYLVDFYRKGRKLIMNGPKTIYLHDEGEDKEVVIIMDYFHYDKYDRFHNPVEKVVIAEHTADDVYSLGLEFNGKSKEISITPDKFGNLILFLNENKNCISYYPGRYRKGGKKFYIPVESEHYTAHEYIEALVKLIDHKNNSPKMIELFELMIRDPRFEKALTYYLNNMPKAKDSSYYEELRNKIEQEYKEKLEALNKSLEQSNLINQLSNEYNGLVPGSIIVRKTKRNK